MSQFQTYRYGFRKLIAWQEAHKLVLMVYEATKKFPSEEKFAMRDQIQRAASSISANIAEGSARKTVKDQNKFYITAKSSLTEVDNFLELAHDLKYLPDLEYRKFLEKVNKVAYLLCRLIDRPQSKPTEFSTRLLQQ